MNRSDVRELHYLTDRANVASIMENGILSRERMSDLPHVSIANESVQLQRSNKRLPSGRMLHEYVPLYFHARNPMMYSRQHLREQIVVLRVSPEVLKLPGVIIADGNASRDFGTAFWGPEEGLQILDSNLVYAEYWTDPDPARQYEKKRVKCAETLVPDGVHPCFFVGGYVSCQASALHSDLTATALAVTIDEHLFFAGPRREGSF